MLTECVRRGIKAGRRVEIEMRGRRFYARITERSGSLIRFQPEQPVPGTKGSLISHYHGELSDVRWAEALAARAKQWAPEDALR